MPIYEYVCRDCGEQVERLQRMSDDPLTDCPACEKPALKRKVSASGFRLSGGGWYETDFKSDGKKNLAGSDEGGSKKSESNADSGGSKSSKETKSETASKPAKTGESKSASNSSG